MAKRPLVLGMLALGLGGAVAALAQPWRGTTDPRPGPLAPLQEQARGAMRSFTHPGLNGVISGRVTLEDGRPAVGYRVRARFVRPQTGAQGEGTAVTGLDGRYTIRGLRPQSFRVMVETGEDGHLPESRHIGMPTPTVSGVNFALRLGPLVTVRATDAETGRPTPGLTVLANVTPFSSPEPVGETGPDGTLRFRARVLDLQMRVEPKQADRARVGIAPGSGYGYRHERLPEPRSVVWEVHTYSDPYANPKRVLRGRVVGPNGAPVAGAAVRLERSGSFHRGRAVSGPDGRFDIPTVRASLAEQVSRGIVLTAERGDLRATVFPSAEETWGELVVRLERTEKPVVTGVVTDPAGRALSGVPVQYLAVYPGSQAQGTIYPRDGGVTGPDGRFAVTVFDLTARYLLQFGGESQFGRSKAYSRTEYPDVGYSNGWMRLKPGEHRDVGRIVVRRADSSIAGRVVDPAGRGLGGFIVVAGERPDVRFVSTEADGAFRIEHLAAGRHRLHVYEGGAEGGRTSPGSIDERYAGAAQAGGEDLRIVARPKYR